MSTPAINISDISPRAKQVALAVIPTECTEVVCLACATIRLSKRLEILLINLEANTSKP